MILTDKETGKEYKLIVKGMQTASNTQQFVVEEILEKKVIPWRDVADGVLVNWEDPDDGTQFMLDNENRALNLNSPHLRFSTEWNHWRGGECPLPEGVVIHIERRKDYYVGVRQPSCSSTHDWSHGDEFHDFIDHDIIAWRFECLADGYCYKDDLEAQGFAVPNSFPGLKNNN